MTNVIGPFDLLTWLTLRGLHEDVKIMQACNDNGKYSECIRKEKNLYKEILQSASQAA